MKPYLLIALGSALGGMGRYFISSWADGRVGISFPVGTMVVNVVGSFLIGVVAAFAQEGGRFALPGGLQPFLMVGFFGGFTTFSSFSLQTLNLMRDGDWPGVFANVLGSVLACLLAVWAGYSLGGVLNR